MRVWLDVVAQGEGPMSPDEIERTLAATAQVQPLEITDEERQQWGWLAGSALATPAG